MVRYSPALSLFVLCAGAVWADADYGAEFKIQQQALVTRDGDVLESAIGDSAALATGSLRLKAQGDVSSWSYDLHYFLEGSYSGDFSSLTTLAPAVPAATLFDLQSRISQGRHGNLNHRLDRASITYSTPSTVIRLGRQALTWGRGQVFQPLDLFNPFSPDAQDRSYKPGTDMIYAQYLFETGADIQAIVVPRRGSDGELDSESGSVAVKGLWPRNNLELETVLALDYGDPVFALGSSGPFGESLWKLDVVLTRPESDDTAVSAVASLHKSWSWRQKPVSGYVEYYRNGFGVTDDRTVDRLPTELSDRIARGQIFNTGRDYLGIGGTVNWTPLLQIAPVAILNLNDRSALAIVNGQYSLSDDSALVVSAQIPIGRRGSEYGGRRMSDAASEYAPTPYSVRVRFERFF